MKCATMMKMLSFLVTESESSKKKKKVNGKNIYILQTLFYISRGPMCATCLALKVV